MKKFNIKTIIAAGSLAILASCSTDYLDVNNDQNEAYVNQLTPAERLSAAETVIFRTQAGSVNRLGNLMMNAWAGNHYYFAAPFEQEFKMQANSTFYNQIWDNYYRGIGNYQTIIDYPDTQGKYRGHIAIARVMKAFYMQTIVDLYNRVPYSDAFKGQANLTPKYDDGKDVYKALINEVNLAITQLKTTNLPMPTAAQDPIMQGTGSTATTAELARVRWLQMAYTVKLKLLTRLSMSTDPEVINLRNQEIATLLSDNAQYIDADVVINPGYSSANTNSMTPAYANFGSLDPAGNINQTFRLIVASKHIMDNLGGLAPRTSGVVDARRGRLFTNNGIAQLGAADISAPAAYRGIQQGTSKDDNFVEGDFTTLGRQMYFADQQTATTTISYLSSLGGIVMSRAESKFLQSEAAVVYPALSALGAETSFTAGINASFTFYGIATSAPAYLAAITSKPGIGWAASTNKLEAIQYQKWVALTNINPIETWISYTKTGFPVTPMPLGSYYPTRPVRLGYPQSEYVANGANVPNPPLDDMYSKTSQYAPFWLK